MMRVIVMFIVFFGIACSSAPKARILPGEDGINSAVARDVERANAEDNVIDGAHEYCEGQDKKMYVLKEEKTEYRGDVDEATRKTVRKVSKVIEVLGGPGAEIEKATDDEDYEARLVFKCK